MLNEQGQRELAYVARITDILPIEGADNIELVVINDGWRCIAKKGEFQKEDLAVYFEIDSKLPEDAEWAAFLAPKHYKVKTYKLGKFKVVSQGLALPADAFGWELTTTGQFAGDAPIIKTPDNKIYAEGDFLTETLKVKYSVQEDNVRKSNVDKYKAMAQRNGKLFSKQPFRWLMKRTWGKKLLFVFFGKKRDNRSQWPSHIASKTDVERIQNMTWILKDKKPFVATEKIDGSSCSIMAERTKLGKIKYYICSRNVVFEDEKQKCYYDENIYFEAYNKYNFKEKITQILNDYNLPNVALQMEVYGPGVQRRDYSLKEHEAMVFHIVSNGKKMPMNQVVEICEKYDLPHVPIINDNYILPDTLEELQNYVENEGSKIDGKAKEGIVFYDKETGEQYFKFVSPKFLLKYHS